MACQLCCWEPKLDREMRSDEDEKEPDLLSKSARYKSKWCVLVAWART